MPLDATVTGLLVALGAGLLIGLERERRKGRGPGRGAAGIRTFTLACVAGALAQGLGQPMLVAVGGAGVVALAALAYTRSSPRDPGLTTELALVAVYLIGALAVVRAPLAAGVAAALAVLLASRDRLHRFATRAMSERELHDALLLAAFALVLLPLVPQQPVAWLGGLQPHKLAAVVLLILVLQAAGHVAQRLFGARGGLLLAGLLSGFASSTATVAAMGQRLSAGHSSLPATSGAAAMSTVATWWQALALLAALAPGAAAIFGPPAVAGSAVALGAALALTHAGRGQGPGRPDPTSAGAAAPPGGVLRLREAAIVGLLLTLATLAVTAAQAALGGLGVLAAAMLSGLVDAHASTAALGALDAAGRIDHRMAATAALSAIVANSLTRVVVALFTGGRAYGVRMAAVLAASLAAALGVGAALAGGPVA